MEIKFANSLKERIILSINNRMNYAAKITKEIHATHTGVTKIIKKLEEIKIIERKIKGRIIYLTLTNKGLRIQNILRELENEN